MIAPWSFYPVLQHEERTVDGVHVSFHRLGGRILVATNDGVIDGAMLGDGARPAIR